MTQYVDQLLREWAHWKAINDDAGLGYPREAPYLRERVQKSLSASDYKTFDAEIPKIDESIRKLPTIHRQIIVLHYCGTGPIKQRAAALQITPRRWYEHVEHAQAFLQTMLDDCAHTISSR